MLKENKIKLNEFINSIRRFETIVKNVLQLSPYQVKKLNLVTIQRISDFKHSLKMSHEEIRNAVIHKMMGAKGHILFVLEQEASKSLKQGDNLKFLEKKNELNQEKIRQWKPTFKRNIRKAVSKTYSDENLDKTRIELYNILKKNLGPLYPKEFAWRLFRDIEKHILHKVRNLK